MDEYIALRDKVEGVSQVLENMNAKERRSEIGRALEDYYKILNREFLLMKLEQRRGYIRETKKLLAEHKKAEKTLVEALAALQ